VQKTGRYLQYLFKLNTLHCRNLKDVDTKLLDRSSPLNIEKYDAYPIDFMRSFSDKFGIYKIFLMF